MGLQVAALTTLVLAVLLSRLYVYLSRTMRSSVPMLRNKRICLLIAHPDDEAMFFAPTVLALTRPDTGNHVKILCLSTGTGRWPETKIVDILSQSLAPHIAGGRRTAGGATQPRTNVDVLITFDGEGISSHPNHTSLYHGARAFLAALTDDSTAAGCTCPVDLYTLTSVGFARKYSSLLDIFTSGLLLLRGADSGAGAGDGHRDNLLFVNKLVGPDGDAALPTAWKAMTEAHASQMRWFRYGWIVLSRYMVINHLKRETV
ncbi:N-acetylglucosaminylphosphatidylinositol deacetylase [Geosmithia morbida]|uniref:N-acetylglucosaminylphosphatidylinositol deacetylase n=1 Tax=Geosmithia morbida TaxID=1094350 RepID=A0A9P4YQB8_9HYPO|nr:N-acetylglucosaminylphosphatidylinositol deacetylase [Geosmithia morbida]KAF4119773.1 N-acetylglucosaminylphosphatidylinositol deacetylase [Geosmithia morbida]